METDGIKNIVEVLIVYNDMQGVIIFVNIVDLTNGNRPKRVSCDIFLLLLFL